MTSFAAERTGLESVGRIATGLRADLVLFDAATVADHATLKQPDAPPVGIRAVLIKGQMVGDGRCGQVLQG